MKGSVTLSSSSSYFGECSTTIGDTVIMRAGWPLTAIVLLLLGPILILFTNGAVSSASQRDDSYTGHHHALPALQAVMDQAAPSPSSPPSTTLIRQSTAQLMCTMKIMRGRTNTTIEVMRTRLSRREVRVRRPLVSLHHMCQDFFGERTWCSMYCLYRFR